MAAIEVLLSEISEVLARLQPGLSARISNGKIAVSGIFSCVSDEGPFDQFDIEISVPTSFPEVEPNLKEVGKRIPHTNQRHVFVQTGCCCLGLWAAWLLKEPEANFEKYLVGPVTSYFISQSIFDITGEWPFGEQGHSRDQMMATYLEALDLPADADCRGYLKLISAPILSGYSVCPCGSGLKLGNCHLKAIRKQRQKMPASLRKAIVRMSLEQIKRAEKG